MMRPLRRDYGQGYPPPDYGGNGAGGYQIQGGQVQNGGGLGGQQQQPGGPMQQQHHQQQQQQQMHQSQQHQQQQQGRPGQGPGGMQGGGAEGQQSNPPPEMNLANVLHYLQSEWRRWERDRNEWEIERAEMRARIALLEGQRRSAENLKVDLLRRVKMLEFALRQERTKSGRSTASRLATLQDEERSAGRSEDKEGSGSSEGGDDIERPSSKVNGMHASGMAKAASTAQRPVPDTSAWKTLSGPPRDPKARARSREYLKQCLQEITYLTSPGALNPLPTRAPVQLDETSGEPTAPERPRKSLPEEPIPPHTQQQPAEEHERSQHAQEQQAREVQPEQSQPPAQPQREEQPVDSGSSSAPEPPSSIPNGAYSTSAENKEPAPVAADAPPSSPAPKTVALPEGGDSSATAPGSKEVLTAIYRPADKASWRDELRIANEEASKVPWPPRRTSDEEQLAGLTLVEEEEGKPDEADGDRIWATRRVLKSHLDIVRGVALAQGPDLTLATGGDDCTVKVWVLDTPSVMSSSYRPLASSEIEPVATYRGHSLPVTAVAVSRPLGVVFSASMDSTIRLWRLPTRDDDPYAAYDPSSTIQTLEGHSDVVWDICLLPSKIASSANGSTTKTGAESQLASVSADGTAKFWEEHDGKWALKSSFSDFDGATPTCLAVDNHNFGRVLIGLSNGVVKSYHPDEGEVASFGEPGGSQVNAIIDHPTLPTIITGHEDGRLQFFDTKTGSASPHLLAHPAPITSLALSPLSPMCILSASVDCSVRLWDLQRKTSLQDLTGHRQRSDEGVTHVASHPELPIVASAGADGIVRVWGAG